MAAVGLVSAGAVPLNLGVNTPKGGGVNCPPHRLSGAKWDTGSTLVEIHDCQRDAPKKPSVCCQPRPWLCRGDRCGGGTWGGTGVQAVAAVLLSRPQEEHS